MTVFLPPPDNNPYLRLLAGALQQCRLNVHTMPVVLSEQWLSKAPASERAVLHFHWPSYGYTDRDREQMSKYVRAWAHALRFAKSLGFKIVWTVHNLYPHEKVHAELEQEARQILIDACDALIVHCNAGLALVQERFNVKAPGSVIPHGHYAGIYGPPAEMMAARQTLDVPQKGTVYLFFGQLRPYKGVDKLVSLFASLPEDIGTLLIAGATMSSEFTRRLIRLSRSHKNVVIHPFFIPDSEVSLYFGAADLSVLPYTDALTSGTVVLAHSMGRPVIAPAMGCLPEMVPEGTGWLYDPASEDSLPKAVESARGPLQASVAQKCYQFAIQTNWHTVAEKTMKTYSQLFV